MKEDLINLVRRIEDEDLNRGKGSETIRFAICKYIEVLALCKFQIPNELKFDPKSFAKNKNNQKSNFLSMICENLGHPNEEIVKAATKALGAFMQTYFINENGFFLQFFLQI